MEGRRGRRPPGRPGVRGGAAPGFCCCPSRRAAAQAEHEEQAASIVLEAKGAWLLANVLARVLQASGAGVRVDEGEICRVWTVPSDPAGLP